MKKSETKKAEAQGGIWGLIDRIQGDKVVWMILILLILFSIVSIFSSTSLLAEPDKGISRLDIFVEQLGIVVAGVAVIFICYKIPYIKVFRVLSQIGFALSAALLLCLICNIGAVENHGAKRALDLGFFQLHVYEVVKVAMVMYLAWAVHAYKSDSFGLANRLSKRYKRLAFLAKPGWKRLVYIYLPIVIVCAGILFGSVSSTLFIGGIMFLTILIGGIPLKDLLLPAVVCIVAGGLCIGLYFVSGGKVFPRVGTAVQRVLLHEERKNIKDLTPGTTEFQKTLDAIRQPER